MFVVILDTNSPSHKFEFTIFMISATPIKIIKQTTKPIPIGMYFLAFVGLSDNIFKDNIEKGLCSVNGF